MTTTVTIRITANTATTDMPARYVGQRVGVEHIGAISALDTLARNGFTVQYGEPIQDQTATAGTAEQPPTSPRDRLLAWLSAQTEPSTVWDATRGTGLDFWLTETLLEQAYQSGSAVFLQGQGWKAATRTPAAEQTPDWPPLETN